MMEVTLSTFEILAVVGSFCSIVSLLLAIYAHSRISKISANNEVKGDENITAGRDANVTR